MSEKRTGRDQQAVEQLMAAMDLAMRAALDQVHRHLAAPWRDDWRGPGAWEAVYGRAQVALLEAPAPEAGALEQHGLGGDELKLKLQTLDAAVRRLRGHDLRLLSDESPRRRTWRPLARKVLDFLSTLWKSLAAVFPTLKAVAEAFDEAKDAVGVWLA